MNKNQLDNFDKSKKLELNMLTTSVVFIYPILIIMMLVYYCMNNTVGKFEILFAVVTYYLCNISVGLGFHRLWSHSSYKAHPILEFILTILTAGTLQGPVLAWVSDHRFHHAYADQDLDPHTPIKYENKIKGFLWAHIGWLMFSKGYKNIDKTTMKLLGHKKILIWQYKHYVSLALFMNFIVPTVIGFLISGTAIGAFAAYLFSAVGRALQQQITFCVNSLCHFMGSKKYVNDTSVDVWWMAPLLLGENWHNFHHAFAQDYRNGHKWHHFDVHKWLIFLLSKIGLASNLVKTPEIRIQAKINEMHKINKADYITKIAILEKMAYQIAATTRLAINNVEAKLIVSKKEFENGILNNMLFSLNGALNIITKFANKATSNANNVISSNIKDISDSYHSVLYKIEDLASKLESKVKSLVSSEDFSIDELSNLTNKLLKYIKDMEKTHIYMCNLYQVKIAEINK